jgi:hypothetical protein
MYVGCNNLRLFFDLFFLRDYNLRSWINQHDRLRKSPYELLEALIRHALATRYGRSVWLHAQKSKPFTEEMGI